MRRGVRRVVWCAVHQATLQYIRRPPVLVASMGQSHTWALINYSSILPFINSRNFNCTTGQKKRAVKQRYDDGVHVWAECTRHRPLTRQFNRFQHLFVTFSSQSSNFINNFTRFLLLNPIIAKIMASEEDQSATTNPIVLSEPPVAAAPKQDRRMSDEWGEF